MGKYCGIRKKRRVGRGEVEKERRMGKTVSGKRE